MINYTFYSGCYPRLCPPSDYAFFDNSSVPTFTPCIRQRGATLTTFYYFQELYKWMANTVDKQINSGFSNRTTIEESVSAFHRHALPLWRPVPLFWQITQDTRNLKFCSLSIFLRFSASYNFYNRFISSTILMSLSQIFNIMVDFYSLIKKSYASISSLYKLIY